MYWSILELLDIDIVVDEKKFTELGFFLVVGRGRAREVLRFGVFGFRGRGEGKGVEGQNFQLSWTCIFGVLLALLRAN